MSKESPKYLGQKVTEPIDDLDTFPAPEGIGLITMTSDEVTSVCPITGQPDFYTVTIEYEPDKKCIESKSLKLYLFHFRDTPGYCEEMAVAIRKKVEEVIVPKFVSVSVIQKPRGGIEIEATSQSGD